MEMLPHQIDRAEEGLSDKLFWNVVGQIGFQPDGSFVSSEETDPNIWQIISDATRTVVTPANAIDLLAFYGAKKGIDNLDSWKGIGITAASFLSDIVDGKVARATGTQSPLGEALDAAGDKVKLAYALVKIWQLDLAPKPLLTAIAMQNLVNSGLTITDQAINNGDHVIHPSWFGKRAMLLQQTGLGLNVIGSQMNKDEMRFGKELKTAGTLLSSLGVVVGFVATAGYAKTLFKSKNKN